MRVLILALVACSSATSPPWETKVGGPSVGPKLEELWLDTRRTTEPDIALRNFAGSIEATRARLEQQPTDIATKRRLADQLLSRVPFLGTFDDFDEVDRLTVLSAEPDAQDVLSRASFMSAVHRFGEARELLDRAEGLRAAPHHLERARIVIDLAVGEHPDALVSRAEAMVEASPLYGTLTVLASVYGAAGRFDDADATYRRALEAYRDVSPLTLAWVSFTRGVMWGEAADRGDLAEVLYRDALRRLPQYVVANVHLSELVDDEEAVRLLESVVETGDPEPAARLSERVEDERQRELVERARQRYEELLGRHRGAFLDHAAEFFLIAGEPARAVELASENIEVRRNPRAYVVGIAAAAEAADREKLCRWLRDALPMRQRHPVLSAASDEHEGECRALTE